MRESLTRTQGEHVRCRGSAAAAQSCGRGREPAPTATCCTRPQTSKSVRIIQDTYADAVEEGGSTLKYRIQTNYLRFDSMLVRSIKPQPTSEQVEQLKQTCINDHAHLQQLLEQYGREEDDDDLDSTLASSTSSASSSSVSSTDSVARKPRRSTASRRKKQRNRRSIIRSNDVTVVHSLLSGSFESSDVIDRLDIGTIHANADAK